MAKKTTSSEKKKDRDYQPMKPDPTSEPKNDVVASRPAAAETEIGSSILRRNEADDED
ncbi:MAG: hypothetical protein V4654_12165 [Bdellovibrionota bacterium]